jgi:uncharacterized protein (TIGR03905 family)
MQKTMTLPTSPAVCSECVAITVEDGCVKSAVFRGGCPGNLAGISKLVEDMPVQEVIRRLRGIRCGSKNTSCPDQLARLLEEHFS